MAIWVGEQKFTDNSAVKLPWSVAPVSAQKASQSFAPARARKQRWIRLIWGVDGLVLLAWMLLAQNGRAAENRTADVLTSGLLLIVWMMILSIKGARQPQILGLGADEYKRVLESGVLTAGLVAISIVATNQQIDPNLLFGVVLPGTISLLIARWMIRRILHIRARAGATLSRVVVIGSSRDIRYLVGQIKEKSAGVYQIVAVINDSNDDLFLDDMPIHKQVNELTRVVKENGADAVIIAGTLRGGSVQVRDIGWELEQAGTELILASALTNVAGPRIRMRPVEGLPLMHVEPPAFSGAKVAIKRILDVILSSVALVLLLPVLGGIALIVRLDSPGPVVFKQRRVGKSGNEFVMFKFRTMVLDAEAQLASLEDANEGSGPLFKMKNDPRVTRVGKILRKLSLDELPQIFNVFAGDMSLVGPRPPLRSEVECYEPHTYRRLLIRPGLTGLWQVNGRSDLCWEDSVRLDLYYVENWSVIGDIIIMWHTFKAMVRPQGAY